jgi:hypothetical protein
MKVAPIAYLGTGGSEMNNHFSGPELRNVRNSCQLIRANWTPAKRRERRQVARTKQRQLIRCLTAGGAADRLLPN